MGSEDVGDTEGDVDTGPERNDWYPCVAEGTSIGLEDEEGYEYQKEEQCTDCANIPAEQCQGHAEWDKYENRPELVKQGRYLVRHVAYCVDCHSSPFYAPEGEDRRLEQTEVGPYALSGYGEYWPWEGAGESVQGTRGKGGVKPRNITPHSTGIGEWTPEQLRTAFTKGLRQEQNEDWPVMFPIMPYWAFHNFSKENQDAIIAYLHQRPAIENEVLKPRQEMPDDTPWKVLDELEPTDVDGDGELDGIGPLETEELPGITLGEEHPDFDQAEDGRQLVSVAACTWCHTRISPPKEEWSPKEVIENYKTIVDADNLLAGAHVWGETNTTEIPSPRYSQNITGHDEFGVGDWLEKEITRAMRQGVDLDREHMCPPMPAGSNSAYAGLRDQHVEAIAKYLKYSEPNDTFNTDRLRSEVGPSEPYDCKLGSR